jgi:hypothetical protein
MNGNILRQLMVIVTTVFALVINGAANAIPLNDRMTGDVAESFDVLFLPAGYVFSIWGVIYIALLAYTIYQALPAQRENPRLQKTGWWVALSSIANGVWIVFWHYGLYELSLLTMLVLLAALLVVYLRLDIARAAFSTLEKWIVSIPFSIYLGWITVATIANITALLAYWGWDGWGISELTWTIIVLAAGVVIGGIMAFTRADVAYLLVLVWAFAGISVRWMDEPVLNVAGFAAAGIVALLLIIGKLQGGRRQERSRITA